MFFVVVFFFWGGGGGPIYRETGQKASKRRRNAPPWFNLKKTQQGLLPLLAKYPYSVCSDTMSPSQTKPYTQTSYPNCLDGRRLVVQVSRSRIEMSNLGDITAHCNKEIASPSSNPQIYAIWGNSEIDFMKIKTFSHALCAYTFFKCTHTQSCISGQWAEEKAFKKRKVFKEDLKELTEVVDWWTETGSWFQITGAWKEIQITGAC